MVRSELTVADPLVGAVTTLRLAGARSPSSSVSLDNTLMAVVVVFTTTAVSAAATGGRSIGVTVADTDAGEHPAPLVSPTRQTKVSPPVTPAGGGQGAVPV